MLRIEQVSFGVLLGGLVLLGAACTPGEGDRCNPETFQSDTSCTPGQSCQDDCSQGLACVYPPGCAVAYCCSATSTNANCQACVMDLGPSPGQDAATDAHPG